VGDTLRSRRHHGWVIYFSAIRDRAPMGEKLSLLICLEKRIFDNSSPLVDIICSFLFLNQRKKSVAFDPNKEKKKRGSKIGREKKKKKGENLTFLEEKSRRCYGALVEGNILEIIRTISFLFVVLFSLFFWNVFFLFFFFGM
jgi:hypothetical protein